MSQVKVERKIVEWVDITPERQWQAKYECGHADDCYDGVGVDDTTKEAIEASGNISVCIECSREEQRIQELEGQLRELKAKRRRK